MENNDYQIMYQDTHDEINPLKLKVVGKIPEWLNGHFIINGPGRAGVGSQRLNTFFEGFALLRKFTIANGEVEVSTKFIQSDAYLESMRLQRFSHDTATTNRSSLLERLTKPFKVSDNPNVNTLCLNNQFLALGGLPDCTEFDRKTLATVGKFHYDDNFTVNTTSPHPHYDYQNNQTIFIGQEIGIRNAYKIFRVKAGSNKRELVARVPVKFTSYIHGFAMSENYFVINHNPMQINPFKYLFGYFLQNKALTDVMKWDSALGSTLIIVNRHTGEVVRNIETSPFFANHYANCFERDGEIIFDCPVTKVDIFDYSMDKYILNPASLFPHYELRRYTVNLSNGTCRHEPLTSDYFFELPRINYENVNTRNYHYIYGVSSASEKSKYYDDIVKLDVQNGHAIHWHQDCCAPQEPVFVAKPGATAEDDGIIISVIVDMNKKSTALIIFEAKDLTEIARAEIEVVFPAMFHSQFYYHYGH